MGTVHRWSWSAHECFVAGSATTDVRVPSIWCHKVLSIVFDCLLLYWVHCILLQQYMYGISICCCLSTNYGCDFSCVNNLLTIICLLLCCATFNTGNYVMVE